ncbi:hypothetical protein C8J30_12119 [Rhodobacter viridis]|uniref:Excisionase family DNA binding protein n=1 Tax=Rhodobacter viridis TaxID=1054202 RepID=A0A318TQL8_9RHOB|nr:hypothetical protein [Rhodobacter viridis]PYF06974.1 hypothetical protein C8J30_12119 [Rhodobacter viridis]
MSQEKLFSPRELSQAVGISVTQIRALMNEGRLEYLAISPKTRLLTMSGWEKFRQTATRAAGHTGNDANNQTAAHVDGQPVGRADLQTGKE